MALLLAGRTADSPFCIEKLNIRIFSREELSYVIVNYPLIALSGLVTEELITWIGNSLHMEEFSERLSAEFHAGESAENLLLLILQNGNFCSAEEIRAFRDLMLSYRKRPSSEIDRETAMLYYRAGKYGLCEEKLGDAITGLRSRILLTRDSGEKERLTRESQELLCDIAAVRMLRFDTEGALQNLSEAEKAGRFQRAEEYRYYITGAADLSDSEKEALEKKRSELSKAAAESEECRKIRELSPSDENFQKKTQAIISQWKNEYRISG